MVGVVGVAETDGAAVVGVGVGATVVAVTVGDTDPSATGLLEPPHAPTTASSRTTGATRTTGDTIRL
jgi:hypothetical protein